MLTPSMLRAKPIRSSISAALMARPICTGKAHARRRAHINMLAPALSSFAHGRFMLQCKMSLVPPVDHMDALQEPQLQVLCALCGQQRHPDIQAHGS